MELLLMRYYAEGGIVKEETKNIVYVCYGFSCLFTLVTIIIYLLNMNQLGSLKIRQKSPRKKPTVILYSILMVFQLLYQVFMITFLASTPNTITVNETSTSTCAGFLSLTIYTSLLFNSMLFALLLRAYRGVKYVFLTHGVSKLPWRYLFVWIIPTMAFVAIIVECYIHANRWSCTMFHRRYLAFVVVIFNGLNVLLAFFVATAIGVMRLSAMNNLNLTWHQKYLRFLDAKRLRNIIVVLVIISVLFSTNYRFGAGSYNDTTVISDAVFRLLLGLHFFLLEFWFFDKDLKTPFRWQRQKQARKDALNGNGHLNLTLEEMNMDIAT